MITSPEHWATSGLLFFSLLLRFPISVYSILSLSLFSSSILPLSHRSINSIRSCLPSSNATEAKLSFDALRIRFPVEFCGDKGSKLSSALPALIHVTGLGAYNIVKRPVSRISLFPSPRFAVASDLLRWKLENR